MFIYPEIILDRSQDSDRCHVQHPPIQKRCKCGAELVPVTYTLVSILDERSTVTVYDCKADCEGMN